MTFLDCGLITYYVNSLIMGYLSTLLYPNPWADPESRSTSGVQNLHHIGSFRIQNWGLDLLDPPGDLRRNRRIDSSFGLWEHALLPL